MPMWARMSEASLSYAPSDAAWAILAPLLEPPTRRGRPRVPERRLVLDAVLHVLRGGLAWRLSTSRRGGASTTNSGAGDGAASGSGSTTPCASGRASWQAEHHVRRRRSSTARPSGPARLAVSAAATAASGSAAASGTSWSIPEALFCTLGCTPPIRTIVARPSRWVWAPLTGRHQHCPPASTCCPSAGSRNGLPLGAVVTVGWPRTGSGWPHHRDLDPSRHEPPHAKRLTKTVT